MSFRLLQLMIVLAPVSAFLWLLNVELVPSGRFEVRHAAGEPSPYLDELKPESRVDANGTMTDEPVFFFAHPHRGFDGIEAEVWFQNNGVPILELGALGNVEAQAYDLRPLQNLTIDQSDWARTEGDGFLLLQREPTYASIADFLADPPSVETIATYHAALARPFRIPGYAPTFEERVTDVSLRGAHEFKTYVKDETLSFRFAYMDMNREHGPDAISIVVTDAEGKTVGSSRASDDGDLSDGARSSPLREVSVSVPGLPEGAYKVQLIASRDVFWRSISTPQRKLVFLNNVFLADEIGYRAASRPVTFWTEAKRLSFATRHAEGVQTVQAGGNARVEVAEPYVRYALRVEEPGVVPVRFESGDIEAFTNGHVAFSPEAYFNPDPVRLAYDTDLDALGIDYILARYVPPERVGDWLVARVTFDARSLVLMDGAWKFAVSAPGVRELGASVTVGRVNMAWTRSPIGWEDMVEWMGAIGMRKWGIAAGQQ